MITTKELRPALFEVSGELKGIKLFGRNKETSKDIQNQIQQDLENFPSITKVSLKIDIEDYMDGRVYYDCAIFNIQMLIQFKTKNNQETIYLIKKYLENTYIAPIIIK